jgi:hypothetical protein
MTDSVTEPTADELYQAVGKFVISFAGTDSALGSLLILATGVSEKSGRILIYGMGMQVKLRKLIMALQDHRPHLAECIDILKHDFPRIVEFRDRLIHWSPTFPDDLKSVELTDIGRNPQNTYGHQISAPIAQIESAADWLYWFNWDLMAYQSFFWRGKELPKDSYVRWQRPEGPPVP